MPQSQKSREENKRSNTVINSIKTLKMVHIKKKKKNFEKTSEPETLLDTGRASLLQSSSSLTVGPLTPTALSLGPFYR